MVVRTLKEACKDAPGQRRSSFIGLGVEPTSEGRRSSWEVNTMSSDGGLWDMWEKANRRQLNSWVWGCGELQVQDVVGVIHSKWSLKPESTWDCDCSSVHHPWTPSGLTAQGGHTHQPFPRRVLQQIDLSWVQQGTSWPWEEQTCSTNSVLWPRLMLEHVERAPGHSRCSGNINQAAPCFLRPQPRRTEPAQL